MKYYVVSDIHGYYRHLINALEEAGFFNDEGEYKLVVCGDLLDRGPEANKTVEFITQLMNEDKLIYILGNHEDLLVQCLHDIVIGGIYSIANGMSYHYFNKTWDTILQLSQMSEAEAYNNPNELVNRVMDSPFYKKLLPNCVNYYETSNYIFTHGWIPCLVDIFNPVVKYQRNPDWRNAEIEAWRSARWFNGMEIACKYNITEPEKTIVCGHWRTSYGHAQFNHSCTESGNDAIHAPFSAKGILAIDSSVAITSTINCVVIED